MSFGSAVALVLLVLAAARRAARRAHARSLLLLVLDAGVTVVALPLGLAASVYAGEYWGPEATVGLAAATGLAAGYAWGRRRRSAPGRL